MLFSVGYGTGLSDHSDLDLSRISHLLLDLLGDVSGESSGLVIADLLGANNDAELAAGLDGVALCDSRIGGGKVFHSLEPLDVRLDDLTTGSRTGTGNRITDHYNRRDDRCHLDLFVVRADGVADLRLFLVLLGQFHTKQCVWKLRLLLGNLTDVVQETGPLGELRIQTELGCHDGADVGDLTGVLEQVLTVG